MRIDSTGGAAYNTPAWVHQRPRVFTAFGWASVATGAYGVLRSFGKLHAITRIILPHGWDAASETLPWGLASLAVLAGWVFILVGGVLLLRQRRAGRVLCVSGAVPVLAVSMFYFVTWLSGFGVDFIAYLVTSGATDTEAILCLARTGFFVLRSLAYPAALLIAMLLPSTARAFRRAGEGAVLGAPEDESSGETHDADAAGADAEE